MQILQCFASKINSGGNIGVIKCWNRGLCCFRGAEAISLVNYVEIKITLLWKRFFLVSSPARVHII